jgi:hypothetical protein
LTFRPNIPIIIPAFASTLDLLRIRWPESLPGLSYPLFPMVWSFESGSFRCRVPFIILFGFNLNTLHPPHSSLWHILECRSSPQVASLVLLI